MTIFESISDFLYPTFLLTSTSHFEAHSEAPKHRDTVVINVTQKVTAEVTGKSVEMRRKKYEKM